MAESAELPGTLSSFGQARMRRKEDEAARRNCQRGKCGEGRTLLAREIAAAAAGEEEGAGTIVCTDSELSTSGPSLSQILMSLRAF